MRFYVYRLYSDPGFTLYIGKGSGRRLKNQMRRFGLQGEVIERFKSEAKAYRREAELIARHRPSLNKAKGGNGLRAKRQYTPRPKPEIPQILLREQSRQILERKGIHVDVPWGYWDELNAESTNRNQITR